MPYLGVAATVENLIEELEKDDTIGGQRSLVTHFLHAVVSVTEPKEPECLNQIAANSVFNLSELRDIYLAIAGLSLQERMYQIARI